MTGNPTVRHAIKFQADMGILLAFMFFLNMLGAIFLLPAMAAFLPCRITVIEQADGLWIYAMNMDMLIKMGRKLPPELKASVMHVRQTVIKMMERGARGEF